MVLSNDEINAAYIEAANQTLRPQDERIALAFARAIIAATIAKLAAGVSVETPDIYTEWLAKQGDDSESEHYEQLERGYAQDRI